MLIISYFLLHSLHKFQPIRLTGGFLEGQGVPSFFFFDTRGLLNLGRFYVEELAISSWRSSLAEKLAVSLIMDFVTGMETYEKMETRLNILGMSFPFLFPP